MDTEAERLKHEAGALGDMAFLAEFKTFEEEATRTADAVTALAEVGRLADVLVWRGNDCFLMPSDSQPSPLSPLPLFSPLAICLHSSSRTYPHPLFITHRAGGGGACRVSLRDRPAVDGWPGG